MTGGARRRTAAAVPVRVNGKRRRVAAGTTLGRLLGLLGADPRSAGVVLNGAVVRRGQCAGIELKEGDGVEILTFAGGG